MHYSIICQQFASDFVANKQELYKAKRNQGDREKIYRDIYFGKLAEFAAYKWLSQFPMWKPSNPPVSKLLPVASWDEDLSNGKYKFAVKSCHPNTRFGYAWTFGTDDPIIHKKDPFYKVVFVVCHSEERFEIYGMASTDVLAGNYIFESTDVQRLKGIKVFIKQGKAPMTVVCQEVRL